jgi:hypothetical protein
MRSAVEAAVAEITSTINRPNIATLLPSSAAAAKTRRTGEASTPALGGNAIAAAAASPNKAGPAAGSVSPAGGSGATGT